MTSAFKLPVFAGIQIEKRSIDIAKHSGHISISNIIDVVGKITLGQINTGIPKLTYAPVQPFDVNHYYFFPINKVSCFCERMALPVIRLCAKRVDLSDHAQFAPFSSFSMRLIGWNGR